MSSSVGAGGEEGFSSSASFSTPAASPTLPTLPTLAAWLLLVSPPSDESSPTPLLLLLFLSLLPFLDLLSSSFDLEREVIFCAIMAISFSFCFRIASGSSLATEESCCCCCSGACSNSDSETDPMSEREVEQREAGVEPLSEARKKEAALATKPLLSTMDATSSISWEPSDTRREEDRFAFGGNEGSADEAEVGAFITKAPLCSRSLLRSTISLGSGGVGGGVRAR